MWSIFTSIQIFSLIHCYLSTTPAPILSWAYFNTPAILFNRSDSVAVLWLAATLARINKRKWSLKKEKIKQNLNAIAEDFSLRKIVYVQGSPALCQTFLLYKPHTQTFLIFQCKWAPEEEVCFNNNSVFRGRYCRWKTTEDNSAKINVTPNIPCIFLLFKASAFLQVLFSRNLLFRQVLRTSVFLSSKSLTSL